jgi:hypothetical protein
MPEYIQLGKELAELIKEFRNQNIKMQKDEYWQIKGVSYKVVGDIARINYKLLQKDTLETSNAVWLSELLPLTFSDFHQLK